jgi:hypothetical protein
METAKNSQLGKRNNSRSNSEAAWQWRKFFLEIIAVIISVTAIMVTIILNRIQERTNQEQFGTVEARLGKLDQPNITAKVKIAFSPNYTNEFDQQYLNQVGMRRKNVGYDFFNQSLEDYLISSNQDQKRYLFIQFMNEGPGIARHLRIDKVSWQPKEGINPPAGLEKVIGVDFGIVSANQMLSFLVDAGNGISPVNPLQKSNAQEICVDFSYTGYVDDTTWIQGKPLCLSTASPAEIEPMRPAQY